MSDNEKTPRQEALDHLRNGIQRRIEECREAQEEAALAHIVLMLLLAALIGLAVVVPLLML